MKTLIIEATIPAHLEENEILRAISLLGGEGQIVRIENWWNDEDQQLRFDWRPEPRRNASLSAA